MKKYYLLQTIQIKIYKNRSDHLYKNQLKNLNYKDNFTNYYKYVSY